MSAVSTRVRALRMAAALGLVGAVVVGLTSSTATASDNVLYSNRAVPRACAKMPIEKTKIRATTLTMYVICFVSLIEYKT